MVLVANYSDRDFVPDGDLDKHAWMICDRVVFNRDAFRGTEYQGIETAARSLWTEQHLYLAFWCRYQALNLFAPDEQCGEDGELWTRDVVEAFIEPDLFRGSSYYEFEVSPDNRSLALVISHGGDGGRETKPNSGFEHATKINCTSRVWTAEMRIPIQSLGVREIVPGTDWRINLYRADGVGSDDQRRMVSWAPLDASNRTFHQPDSFGILRFVKL